MRQLFVCALLLFTLPVLATPLPSEPHIYVEGSATLDVEPSYMVLAVAVEATDLDLEKAKGDVDGRARQLIELADVLGIERSDVDATIRAVREALAELPHQPVGTSSSSRAYAGATA